MGVHEESLQPHHRQRNKNNSCFLLATIPPFCIMICIWALMGKSCPKNKQDLSERCLREVFGNCQAVTYARRMELMDSLTPDRLCWNENALCSPWHSLGKFCWPEPSDPRCVWGLFQVWLPSMRVCPWMALGIGSDPCFTPEILALHQGWSLTP